MAPERDTTNEHVDPDNANMKVQQAGAGRQSTASEIAALSRVSAAISSLRDLDAILQVALDNVLEIMNGTIGGILLFDEESQTLSYRVYRGLSAKYVEEMHLRVGEGIAGKVAQTGHSILLEDISADPRTARPEWVKREGLKGWLSVPLRAKEAVLGVINVAGRMPHQFTEKDRQLLHSIGDQVGVAVEEAKLLEELRQSREMYRHLAQRVILAQEDERKRLAMELHDETSQALSGLALNLQVLLEMSEIIGVNDPQFKSRMKKAHALSIQIGNEVSRLIADLRPTLLDTLGLIPAIRQYAESHVALLGIKVSFDFDEINTLPPEMEAGLFRWAQAAMGNIIRHSEAKNAKVSIKREGTELMLLISDDGKGFDVSQLARMEETGRGAGVFGMKERIRILGGKCSVKSQPGKGTTVTARVPLHWIDADAQDKSASGG